MFGLFACLSVCLSLSNCLSDFVRRSHPFFSPPLEPGSMALMQITINWKSNKSSDIGITKVLKRTIEVLAIMTSVK